jgi:hypothetical protein
LSKSSNQNAELNRVLKDETFVGKEDLMPTVTTKDGTLRVYKGAPHNRIKDLPALYGEQTGWRSRP